MTDVDDLAPITHPLLDVPGVRHGFFTRAGGVSEGLYAGLNVGVGSSDDPAAVAENRRRVAAWFGRAPEELATCYQIHSAITRVADRPWNGARPEGDAVASATFGLVCGVLTADCAPVLICDPEGPFVAAVHAGWKGALQDVTHSAVQALAALGARPSRMRAIVGPCIGPDSYEVGAEFRERFAHHDPGSEQFFRSAATDGKALFHLPAFVLWRLEQAGVGAAAWTGHDTCADETRFYSNRRAFQRGEPDFGRLMSAICIE
jgi:YfiH family protein